jgi:hypothetical protein
LKAEEDAPLNPPLRLRAGAAEVVDPLEVKAGKTKAVAGLCGTGCHGNLPAGPATGRESRGADALGGRRTHSLAPGNSLWRRVMCQA